MDRLGIGGRTPSPSPYIDNLLSSGICLTNAFSVGCPTEFSYPGIVTSTLPFDKGGYGEGISNRDMTIAEVFRAAGYRTVRFADDHVPSSFGYNRGYHDCLYMYDIVRFFADIEDTIPYYRRLWKSGEKTSNEVINILDYYVNGILLDIATYCQRTLEDIAAKVLLPSTLLHEQGLDQALTLVKNAYAEFISNRENFVLNLLTNKKATVFDSLWAIVKKRQEKTKLICNRKYHKYQKELLYSNLKYLICSMLDRRVAPRALKSCIRFLHHGNNLRIPSSAYIIQNFLAWHDINSANNPFFAWIHLSDIHERNIYSFDLFNNENMEREFRKIRELRDNIHNVHNFYGDPLYDYSVKYTDLQIEYLFKGLHARNILDNTLIVLTADHGHSSSEWPIRRSIHVARDFYDELYHIPLAFINKEFQAREIKALCSAIDIGPTLLDILGMPIPSSFRGMSVLQCNSTGRRYILMEHLGPGPCDFISKPLKVCVRSKENKLVYEEYIDSKVQAGNILQFFDLSDDPYEQINIAATCLSTEKEQLLKLAKERVSAIREGYRCC